MTFFSKPKRRTLSCERDSPRRRRMGPKLAPLVREFLLRRLVKEPDSETRIRDAIESLLSGGAWKDAFELIQFFDRTDIAEHALICAMEPVFRAETTQSLGQISRVVNKGEPTAVAVVDLASAVESLRSAMSSMHSTSRPLLPLGYRTRTV